MIFIKQNLPLYNVRKKYMTEPLQDPENDISFQTKYRKDKTREGYFYVGLGVLFLVWTAFDIAFAFFEEMWYFNIFFGLLGLGMLIYGIIEIRANRENTK